MAAGELLCFGMQKIWAGMSRWRSWCWCCVLSCPCTLTCRVVPKPGQDRRALLQMTQQLDSKKTPQRITGKKKGQVHSIYSHNFTSCAHSVEIMKTNFWVSLLFLRLLSVPDSSWVVLARTECCVGRAGTAGKLLAFRFKKCRCNYFLNAAIIRNAFKCCLQTLTIFLSLTEVFK